MSLELDDYDQFFYSEKYRLGKIFSRKCRRFGKMLNRENLKFGDKNSGRYMWEKVNSEKRQFGKISIRKFFSGK